MVSPQSISALGHDSRSKRRAAATVLTATVAMILAACGSSASAGSGAIVIAAVADETGPVALLGTEGLAGFSDAIADTNASGGIDGRKIKIESYDGQSEANASQVAWRNAYGKKPRAVFFSGISSNLAAGFALQSQKKNSAATIPVLATSSTDEMLSQDWFFTEYATSHGGAGLQVDAAKAVAGGSLNGKSVGLVSVSSAAADSQIKLITDGIKAEGGMVAGIERNETGIASFATQAQKLASKRPDVVITLEGPDQVVVTKALVTAGVTAPIVGSITGSSDAQMEAINAKNYVGLRDVTPVAKGTDLYATAYKHGSTAKATSGFYVYGYAMGALLTKAFNSCGADCSGADLTSAIKAVGPFTPPNYLAPLDFSDAQSGVTSQTLFSWDRNKKQVVKVHAPIPITTRD